MAASANHPVTHEELIERLNLALREASTATVLIHGVLAAKFGLNVSDWKCGELVNRHGRLTAGQLAEMTGLTTGTITVIIDRLERARFVRRMPDPHDRRKVWVEAINDRATEVKQVLDEAFAPVLAWMATYRTEELAFILDFMQRNTALVTEAALRLQ